MRRHFFFVLLPFLKKKITISPVVSIFCFFDLLLIFEIIFSFALSHCAPFTKEHEVLNEEKLKLVLCQYVYLTIFCLSWWTLLTVKDSASCRLSLSILIFFSRYFVIKGIVHVHTLKKNSH